LLVFRATTVHLPLNEKAGPASTYVHRGPALIYFAEPHQTAAMLARDGKAALARLDVSQQILCGRELLLFLLAGLLRLLRFLRFLSHIALRDPNVGSMQVDFDEHKYRIHHNRKIDIAGFEEGKRRSRRCTLRATKLSLASTLTATIKAVFPPRASVPH
jgi:hypothetical protein